MTALLLVAGLAVLTLYVAHQLELVRDVGLVIAACLVVGVAWLAIDPRLAWVAEPKDDGACEAEGFENMPLVERVPVAEARELLERSEVTFVDARHAADYSAAHIPGAMSLPASDAELVLDMQSLPIPPEGEVIAYCEGGSCEQSEYLGLLLRDRGVCRKVRVLEGGWQAWQAVDAPTVSGDTRFGDAPRSSVAPAPNLEAAG